MGLDLIGVFGAGLATFVTPCVLPLVPIYLSALLGGDIRSVSVGSRGQLLGRAALFSLGFIAVFTVMGLGASSLGGLLIEHKVALKAAGAVLILVFGLKFLGVIRIPMLDRVVRGDDRRLQTRFGTVNAVLMGVVFAAGWSPCIGPVLGSILGYTAQATSSPWVGAGYLATYGLGFAVPLMLTAAFAEAGTRALRRLHPLLPKIELAIGGTLVVVAGVLLVDLAPTLSAPASQATVTGTPMMVELYSKDCHICQQMKPVVDQISDHCQGKSVLIETFDVSKPENRDLISRHRVVGVPTFVFLDATGAEVARLVGRQTAGSLKQALAVLRGESCPDVGVVPSEPAAPSAAEAPAVPPGHASCQLDDVVGRVDGASPAECGAESP